jgi:hypothetical protein
MSGLPTARLVLYLSVVLAAACCAVGWTAWYFGGSAEPPPLPALPAGWEDDRQVDSGLTLPESERTFLWDVEHHGNVLNACGFKRLADALRDGDAGALANLFAEDFTGDLPAQPNEVSLHREGLDVVRREDKGSPPIRVGAKQFIAHLLEYRRAFAEKPPGVQLVLKTLLPKVRGEKDGLWEGLAQLRLHGESHPGQPSEVVVILRYEVARPTRKALAGSGWFRAAAVRQSLVARSSHYLMAEVARQRGLDPSLFHDNWSVNTTSPESLHIATGGVFVCDFDRDGILDVLITDVNRYVLYRGLPGGRFVDVTEEMGLPRSPSNRNPLSGVACWIDIDGDGWDDLVLAGMVFRNVEGKRFVNQTPWAHLPLPPDTISLVVADYDRDGRLDLYATRTGSGTARSWLSGKSGIDAGNRLYRNKGDWKFEDVTARSRAGGGFRSTFTAVWLDADDDGWPDLYVTNEFGNGVLLLNNRDGTFREQSLGSGYTDFGTMGAAAGDVDGDGRIDLYCANMYSKAGSRIIGNLPAKAYPADVLNRMRRFVAGSQLHLNKGGHRFEQVGERMQVHAVGWAYGPALADLDNDGWLDLYATAGQISRDRNKPDG